MMMKLCEEAAKRGKPIFLYGGKPGVADAAQAKLKSLFPSIKIVGTQDGYEKTNRRSLIVLMKHNRIYYL